MQKLCYLTKGLVLVTGPTGSGKSTTLCALVDLVNRSRGDHIITIEDPIEFVHPSKKCLVTQRQVGVHTDSFKSALRAALREDPDVILVGEMRDLETIAIAIETAETGHLVFGTLHTTTAASTVDRIIDQFPADRQAQIRVMLTESLKGVISQTLCRKIGGGRVAAREVLLGTPAVSNLIREGKTFQIPAIMQTSKKLGMVTLNDALMELVDGGAVEPKEAYMKGVDKAGLVAALRERGHDVSWRRRGAVAREAAGTHDGAASRDRGPPVASAVAALRAGRCPPRPRQGAGGRCRQLPRRTSDAAGQCPRLAARSRLAASAFVLRTGAVAVPAEDLAAAHVVVAVTAPDRILVLRGQIVLLHGHSSGKSGVDQHPAALRVPQGPPMTGSSSVRDAARARRPASRASRRSPVPARAAVPPVASAIA